MTEYVPIGLLLNPRNAALTLGCYVAQRYGAIFHGIGGRLYYEANGYLENSEYDDEYGHTICEWRTHTPGGVHFKNKGWGTCLYANLMLVARWIDENADAVCSPVGDRSAEAERWWDKARYKYDLVTLEGAGIGREEVEDADVDPDYARDALDGYDGIDVESATITADYVRIDPDGGGEVTVLRLETLWRRDLLAAMIDKPEGVESILQVPGGIPRHTYVPQEDWLAGAPVPHLDRVNYPALAGSNVVGLPYGVVAFAAGILRKENALAAEDMIRRWQADADPDTWDWRKGYKPNRDRKLAEALERTADVRRRLRIHEISDLP